MSQLFYLELMCSGLLEMQHIIEGHILKVSFLMGNNGKHELKNHKIN